MISDVQYLIKEKKLYSENVFSVELNRRLQLNREIFVQDLMKKDKYITLLGGKVHWILK